MYCASRQWPERIGKAEGADLEIIEAAAYLHDSRGASPEEGGKAERASHCLGKFAGEVLARKGWSQERIEAVQHCIRAHRFRHNGERPESLEAQCLFDAKISWTFWVRLGQPVQLPMQVLAGQPVLSEPSQQFLETGIKEPGEPHSSYHEYLFKLRKVKDQLFTTTGKAIAKAAMPFWRSFTLVCWLNIKANAEEDYSFSYQNNRRTSITRMPSWYLTSALSTINPSILNSLSSKSESNKSS